MTKLDAGILAVTLIAVLSAFFAAPSAVLAQPVLPGSAVPSVERITSFTSDITVQEDGTVVVTERIEYYFPEPKHGFIRTLPLRYRDDGGQLLEMPINVRSVTAITIGAVPFSTERSGERLNVDIGDPEKTVSGSVAYVISYDIRGALQHYEDHDELHWNVTGYNQDVPVDRSGATVRLPDAVPAEGMTARCFTGPAGSTAQDCMAGVQGRAASFAASGPLTVVVGWQPGAVSVIEPILIPDPLLVRYPFVTALAVALLSGLGILTMRRPGVERD